MNNLLTQKFPVAAIVLLLTLGVSCAHEPAVENGTPDATNIHEWEDSIINGNATMSRMMFSVGSGISVTRDNGTTRSETNTTGISKLSVNDLITIGVKRGTDAEETKDYYVNSTTKMSVDPAPEVWKSTLTYFGDAYNAFFWKSKTESIKVRAWSYGNSTKTTDDPDGAEYELPNDQSSGYGELLYSPSPDEGCKYTDNDGTITLSLYHQLSRIVINITYDSGSSLSSIHIGDGTSVIPRTATFHKPTSGNTGTWDTFGAETDQITPKEETANSCYSAVLLPTTYTSGTKLFCITIGNEAYAYTLPENLEFEAGNQYNFTITVKRTALSVTSTTVSAWGNGIESNSSSITAAI